MTEQDPLARLLAGTFPDPDGGPALQVATRKVVIAPSLSGEQLVLEPPADARKKKLPRELAEERGTHVLKIP